MHTNCDRPSDDEEPVPATNGGSKTSPRSRPRSPWTTDESSDSEGHADNTAASRLTLTSIKEKAAIQYPITPESSLVCAKEEPPRLDPSVTDPEGLCQDLVSRTCRTFTLWHSIGFTVYRTVFNRHWSSLTGCRTRTLKRRIVRTFGRHPSDPSSQICVVIYKGDPNRKREARRFLCHESSITQRDISPGSTHCTRMSGQPHDVRRFGSPKRILEVGWVALNLFIRGS
jgi:hypothetical protein